MITKFQLYESSRYLDVKDNYCGVCGTEGTFVDINDMGDTFENHYKCPNCDFEWYSLWSKDEYGEYEGEDLYSIEGVFTEEGNRLNYDDYIPPRLYDELKLQANKYNL